MIRILFTGGTISMQHDAARGGHVPTLGGAALLALAPDVAAIAPVEVEDFAKLPAVQQSLEWLSSLQRRVAELAADPAITGIVVTHGTDTLEEPAYLLARTVAGDTPIVLTGAMRTAGEPDWDGTRNLTDAVRVAADPASRGRGALVVFHGRILPGLGACKRHAMALDAFTAPHLGDEGQVIDGGVTFFRPAAERRTAVLSAGLHARVPVVYSMTADDGELLRSAAERADGIVVVGAGSGNLPPALAEAAFAVMETGRPVVLASRCLQGEVTPVYGFDGGSAVSVRRGLVPAGPRTAQLARLELAIAISAGVAYGG